MEKTPNIDNDRLEKAKAKAKKIDNMDLQSLSGQYTNLREMQDDNDLKDLFNLINFSQEFTKLVSKKFKSGQDFESFKQEIAKWFETDTNFIFLARNKLSQVFGVTLLYNLNTLKDEVKLSIFIDKDKRNTRSLLEVFLITLDFIVNKLEIENIKFNVYKDNDHMLKIIRNREDFGIKEISDNLETKTFLLPKESALKIINRFKEVY